MKRSSFQWRWAFRRGSCVKSLRFAQRSQRLASGFVIFLAVAAASAVLLAACKSATYDPATGKVDVQFKGGPPTNAPASPRN